LLNCFFEISDVHLCSCWSIQRRCRCRCGISPATPFPSARLSITCQSMLITWCSAAVLFISFGFFHSRLVFLSLICMASWNSC